MLADACLAKPAVVWLSVVLRRTGSCLGLSNVHAASWNAAHKWVQVFTQSPAPTHGVLSHAFVFCRAQSTGWRSMKATQTWTSPCSCQRCAGRPGCRSRQCRTGPSGQQCCTSTVHCYTGLLCAYHHLACCIHPSKAGRQAGGAAWQAACASSFINCFIRAWRVRPSVLQSTVKHQLSADEAKAQAAELVRKARIKREREEAELARVREREVGAHGPGRAQRNIASANSRQDCSPWSARPHNH